MDHVNTLIGLAQISLVLTGFVAVFVAFYAGTHPPSKPDIHHAFAMLMGSVVALLLTLIPIVLGGYGLSGEKLWYWASLIGAPLGMLWGLSTLRMTLKLSKEEFVQAGIMHMLTAYTLGTSATGLMLWNIFTIAGPGHYVLATILTLMVALIGFVSFSLQNFLKL
ncbi:MAG: hypothetical protein Cons2KO_34280 [Congregibacter sp.]